MSFVTTVVKKMLLKVLNRNKVLLKEELIMLLLAIAIFVICCLAEDISDRIDAYNYNKNGGFYAKYPCFKPKNENKK